MTTNFVVNDRPASTDAPPATPLLWVIREQLKLTGTKFGCGTGLCGACTIHIDGKRAFSCQIQVSEVAGKSVMTIEGLSPEFECTRCRRHGWRHRCRNAATASPVGCMSAAALLMETPKPTRAQIVEHMSANIVAAAPISASVRRSRTRRAGGLSHDDSRNIGSAPARVPQALAPPGHGRRRGFTFALALPGKVAHAAHRRANASAKSSIRGCRSRRTAPSRSCRRRPRWGRAR